MCGIAGFIQSIDSPAQSIESITDSLAHRGPDGCGYWHGTSERWQVALGHRRLSIIDLAGGAQPMSRNDFILTFNGEIYNYRSLRTKMAAHGASFTTSSDTEVLLEQFIRSGTAGLLELNGMFAFAAWNRVTQTLTLARDRAGIKPLYYSPLADGGLVFASELSALLKHDRVARSIDQDALASFFFRDYVPPGSTILKSVFKLAPGHFITWQQGKLSPATAYWKLVPARQTSDASPEECEAELDRMLHGAVEAQMVADVPVGVFLSGGIDSSLVAALAQPKTGTRLSTFSIGFEDPDFDESHFARVVAEHIGSNHIEERVSEKTLLAELDHALDCLDEPMGDPSILPTYLVSRLAARHVKVVLGGDGGDELWAGYPTYKAHKAANHLARIPSIFRRSVINPLVAALPVRHGYQSLEWKLKRLFLRWEDQPLRRHQHWMSASSIADLRQLGGEVAVPWHDSPMHLQAGESHDRLNGILAYDFATYLSGSVLSKVDRASMRNSLEVRPPLLHNELIDYAFSLPSSLKLRGRESKWLLKRVAQKYLPSAIVHRRKKGFAIPLARWIAGPLQQRLNSILKNSPVWDWQMLNRETFAQWVNHHQLGHRDASKPLWSLIVLDHWARKCVA